MSNDDLLHIVSIASDVRCHVYLCGEADISGVVKLAAALDAIAVRAGQEIHVDVGDLDFIDLACLRALICFARRAQNVGVDVQVHRPNRGFRMIHRMVDPGALHLTDVPTERPHRTS